MGEEMTPEQAHCVVRRNNIIAGIAVILAKASGIAGLALMRLSLILLGFGLLALGVALCVHTCKLIERYIPVEEEV
jgi:hypothetical protein